MRASKALLMRRASESLRSLDSTSTPHDDDGDSGDGLNVDLTSNAASYVDQTDRLILGRLKDLTSCQGPVSFAAWSEREWALRTCGNKVHLDAVDFVSMQFLPYQWIAGESSEDIAVCSAFAPPLIPLRPPSSLHECRSLEATGTFAIAWRHVGESNESGYYIRVYDPEDSTSSATCQDRKWVFSNHLVCSIGKVNSLAFSPGGNHLLAGGNEGIQLWNLSLNEAIWMVRGQDDCPGPIKQVQFSPDGRLFASMAQGSKMVRLWWRSESASHGGFAFLLLPHGDPVKSLSWRPRSSSSIYGTAQSLLTQTESGTIRVWQESDPLEDFDFYIVCEMAHSPHATVTWIEYFADYDGLLWPPASSFRKRQGLGLVDQEQDPKKTRTYSSKRVWGALDRGHGHAWFGEAAYDNLESRLGSFPSSSNTRDWIVSLEKDNARIWAVEGLGEHARTAIRCEVWIERGLNLPDSITSAFAFCRFIVPVCFEGRTMPRCDELFGDNVPARLRLCVRTQKGALGLVNICFGEGLDANDDSHWTLERRSHDESFDVAYSFSDGHLINAVTLLARTDRGEILTCDDHHRVIWWNLDGRVHRKLDMRSKVALACLAGQEGRRRIVVVEEETGQVSLHEMMVSRNLANTQLDKHSLENEFGKMLALHEVLPSRRLFIIRERCLVEISLIIGRKIVMEFDFEVRTCCLSSDGHFFWVGTSDGILVKLVVPSVEEEVENEEPTVEAKSTTDSEEPKLQSGKTIVRADSASPAPRSPKWVMTKLAAAGMWVCRVMVGQKENTSGRVVVAVSSLASNLLADFDGDDVGQQILGLGDTRNLKVIDCAMCEFGSSLVCGIALLLADGSVKVCSRKHAVGSWMVIANAKPAHGLGLARRICWSDQGKLLVFGREAVVEYPGWTSNLPIDTWNFSGGLGGDQKPSGLSAAGSNMRSRMLKRASSLIRQQVLEEELTVTNSEAAGNVAWACASTQFALPAHHPESLLEDFRQGRLARVEKVLQHLANSVTSHLVKDRALVVPPCADLASASSSSTVGNMFEAAALDNGKDDSSNLTQKLKTTEQESLVKTTTNSAKPIVAERATASALFAEPVVIRQTIVAENEEPEAVEIEENDWLSRLENRLPMIRISGISPSDHLSLLSCVNLFRRLSSERVSGLDVAGARYALVVETLRVQSRGTLSNGSLKTSDIVWAIHSDAHGALIKRFLEQPGIVWADLRAIGAAFWLQNPQDLISMAERLAKSQFIKYDKDPFRCLLMYCALNKPRVASALFKASKNEKVAQLLAQNFSDERWKSAAVKNGFALVEKKRFEEAAAFFLLGGRYTEALRVLARSLEDFQLGLFVAKILALTNSAEGVPALREYLRDTYMEVARATRDPWLMAIIYTLQGEPIKAIRCFAYEEVPAPAGETSSQREKRLERYAWLRDLSSKDKPRPSGFDPLVLPFLEHVLSRAPFFFNRPANDLSPEMIREFKSLVAANREKSIYFYLSEGLPRLAQDLLSPKNSEDGEDNTISQKIYLEVRANISASLPDLVYGGGKSKIVEQLDDSTRTRLMDTCHQLNLVKALLSCAQQDENKDALGEAIERFVSKKIAMAFRSLAFGGVSSTRVSARRLAAYALCVNDQIVNLPPNSSERLLASMASYAAVTLSLIMLKQFAILDACFSSGGFEPFEPLRLILHSSALRISKDFNDYEELLGGKVTAFQGEWAPTLAREVLKLLILEEVVSSLSAVCQADSASSCGQLVSSVAALVARLRSDIHTMSTLPDTSVGFSAVVDPLRPYLATTRSFEDFNEQALWTRFSGPERILKLVGELAHSFRFRNKRPFLPSHATRSSALASPPSDVKRGPLTSITLYQSHGEHLCGVVLSQAFSNYMVIGSAERGSRDINIKSSLRFRQRTPDGRGLVDTEKESWSDAYRRFADKERSDLNSEDGWELYLSASATGMRHRYANPSSPRGSSLGGNAYGSSPSLTSRKIGQIDRVQRAGSFLSFSQHRMKLALKQYVGQQASVLPLAGVISGPGAASRDEPITRITAHPILPIFATGSNDGTAHLWHIGEPRAVCKLARPLSYMSKAPITRLRFSPGGFKVLGADSQGRCSLWQIDMGESQPFSNFTCASAGRSINDIAFLNLSSVFATCSNEGIVSLWDTLLPSRSCCVASWYQPPGPSTALPSTLPAPIGLASLAFSPQTRCLFTGSERGALYSIDVRQCRTAVECKQAHNKSVVSLAISPDGYTLGSGSADGSLKMYNLDDLSPIATLSNLHPYSFTHHQAITEITFAPNGSVFSCGADGTVKITYSSEAVM